VAALLGALMPLLQDARLPENRAAAAAEGCVDPFNAAPPPAPAAERGRPAGPAGWAGGLAAVFALLLGALGALGRGELRADPAYLHAARALLAPLLRAAAAPGWPRAALQRLDGAGPAGGPGPALPAAIDALPAAFPSLPEAGALRSALLAAPRWRSRARPTRRCRPAAAGGARLRGGRRSAGEERARPGRRGRPARQAHAARRCVRRRPRRPSSRACSRRRSSRRRCWPPPARWCARPRLRRLLRPGPARAAVVVAA